MLQKNSKIFSVIFAEENVELFIFDSMALKFTQKGDQS